jgi:hypothetical protein
MYIYTAIPRYALLVKRRDNFNFTFLLSSLLPSVTCFLRFPLSPFILSAQTAFERESWHDISKAVGYNTDWRIIKFHHCATVAFCSCKGSPVMLTSVFPPHQKQRWRCLCEFAARHNIVLDYKENAALTTAATIYSFMTPRQVSPVALPIHKLVLLPCY